MCRMCRGWYVVSYLESCAVCVVAGMWFPIKNHVPYVAWLVCGFLFRIMSRMCRGWYVVSYLESCPVCVVAGMWFSI